jgi:cation diffusion facilitator family transporter
MNTTPQTIPPNSRIKLKVQRVIAIFSIVIFAGKLFAFFLTNSVGVLTDALESTVNVVTGLITLYSVYISLKPKDRNHPFGHGKIEFLSASLEGFLIIVAGLIIIFEAIKRIITPSEVGSLDIGIIIVALAGALNYLVGWYSIRVGKKNNSIALISGGKHLQSDTYSSIGLVLGLLILFFTKIAWIDSAIGLLFGTIIILTGYRILKETTSNLMDEVDFKLISEIVRLLNKNRTDDWIDIHNLKLVKYGSSYHVNFDIILPWYMNICDAHNEGEKIKKIIIDNFADDIVFTIHNDDCRMSFCENCKKPDCRDRKNPFVTEIIFNTENLIGTMFQIRSSKKEAFKKINHK